MRKLALDVGDKTIGVAVSVRITINVKWRNNN